MNILYLKKIKKRIKRIANELNINFEPHYTDYVKVNKFYYHLIEFLNGNPMKEFDKYDYPSRIKNLNKFISEINSKKNKYLYEYMHYYTSGNVFTKKSLEKIKKELKNFSSKNTYIEKLISEIEYVLSKFHGNYLIVLAKDESTLDKKSNKILYFHECIHVLLNENGLIFKKNWLYNEGLVTYFQAKLHVNKITNISNKIKILKTNEYTTNDELYYKYAEKWVEFFEKYSDKSSIEVIKIILKQKG